jgi:hypothetical protein
LVVAGNQGDISEVTMIETRRRRNHKRFGKKLVWWVAGGFFTATILSCATVKPPRPKVVFPPVSYPNSATVAGVSAAAVLFEPNRDMYAAPHDAGQKRQDFNWLEAGICPARLILENGSDRPVTVDPTQITCTDAAGVTYKPYSPQEAGDAVVSSEAFNAYVRGAIAGALLGAALGAGLGAAVGGVAGGGRWAGRGAAIGATSGGTQGLVLGSVANRQALEIRVRTVLLANQLQPKVLSRGMSHEGLVYLPVKEIRAIRMLLAAEGGHEVINIEIPVTMPVRAKVLREEEQGQNSTPGQ